MHSGRKYWILLTLTCLLVGSTVWILTPTSRASMGAPGATNARRAAQPQAKATLHASALAAQSRFSDAADLQESSAATGRVVGELAADFNLDGALDLVTLRNTQSGGEIEVRMGTLDGGRGLPVSFPVAGEVTAFDFGHFTASGNMDIVVAGADGTLSVLNGDGQGGFTPGATMKVGGHISSIVAGDITRSGLDDVVVVDQADNSLKIVRIQGDLGAATVQSLSVNGLGRLTHVRMADFDNDYYPDIVVAGDQGVAVMYGDGAGSFGNRRNLGNPGPATGIAIGDFRGHAFPDLAVSTPTGVAVWTNRLAKGFSKGAQYAAGSGVTGVIAGNFNDDEFTDLAAINGDTSQVSILFNAGGKGFLPPMAMDVDGGPSALVAGRFAHSGINSIAVGKQDGRTVMAVPQVINTVTVTTSADENDCPACTVTGVNSTTSILSFTNAVAPNANPGGGAGISLREAITAINNEGIQGGATGWTISFQGISRHKHDNMEAASTQANCLSPNDTFWNLAISIGNLPAILSPGLTIDGTLFNNDTTTMGDGVTNTLGPSVFLSGAGAKLVITSSAPGCTVKGLGFSAASGDAIAVFSPNCNVMNNVIGLACDSVTADGASGAGIELMSGSKGEVISGNTISKNANGIIINGVSQSVATPQNNTISGNKIGITRTLVGAGNTNDGILLQAGATGNTISGNTISGNGLFGVEVNGNITSNTIIQSNFIGTDPSGVNAIGNTMAGIGIDTASGTSKFNQITSNVISGNTGNGIRILADSAGLQSNVVAQNKIGVNVTGSVQVPNLIGGVVLDGQASGNTIGGATYAGSHNEISGNNTVGVWIKGSANNNIIQNNDIGPNNLGSGSPADLTHTRQVSNKGGGVLIEGTASSNTLIQNNIAFNEGVAGNSGITHNSSANFNKFTQNNISFNPPDGPPGGPTIQDNNGQQGMLNAQITTAITSLIKVDTATTISQGGQTTITGTANFLSNSVTANINQAVIEIFVSQRGSTMDESKSEGQAFIGSVGSFQVDQANPNTVDWVANLVVPQPFLSQTNTVFITATITTGDGSTSPFSIGKIAQCGQQGCGATCQFQVTPSLNFNNAPIGQTTNQTLALSNTGGVSVTVTAVTLTQSGSLFTRSNLTLPLTIPAGQTVNVTIGFTPTDTSQQTASIRVSDSCTADIIVPVTGNGAAAATPKIGVVPPALNFGNVNVSKSASLQFFVSNFGNAPLNVATLTLQAGVNSQFSIPSNPAPFTVPAQSTSAGITVNFNPTSNGSKTDTLVIASNDPTTASFNLPLSGTGVQTAPPVVTVQTPTFGQVVIPGQPFNVNFMVVDSVSVVNYQILLSTNNGVTFTPGFGSGGATTGANLVSITLPAGTLSTTIAVLQVKVLDSAANTGTGNSAPFTIGAQVLLINPFVQGKKFFTTVSGSGIQAGARLTFTGVGGNDTWLLTLSSDGSQWIVFKSDQAVAGTDTGLKFKGFANFFSGQSVPAFVKNPDGSTSTSVLISFP